MSDAHRESAKPRLATQLRHRIRAIAQPIDFINRRLDAARIGDVATADERYKKGFLEKVRE